MTPPQEVPVVEALPQFPDKELQHTPTQPPQQMDPIIVGPRTIRETKVARNEMNQLQASRLVLKE